MLLEHIALHHYTMLSTLQKCSNTDQRNTPYYMSLLGNQSGFKAALLLLAKGHLLGGPGFGIGIGRKNIK